MAKFLDENGLIALWNKIKSTFVKKVVPSSDLGSTYVTAVQEGNAGISVEASTFGDVFNGPVKDYRVGLGLWPSNGNEVQLYSVSNENVASTTNTKAQTLFWNAGTGRLQTKSLTISNNDMNAIDGSGILVTGTSSNYVMTVQNTSVTKGTAPSAASYWGISFHGNQIDNYNKRIGMLETTLSTTNVSTTAIRAYNCTTATNTGNCSITVNVDASGNAYTSAPTTTAADNSTKIATTAWVRSATGNFACNAATATKVGTATVGSSTKPIYLNAGAPTAFSGTVGTASKPVFLNAGAITACSATVGGAAKPVWLSAGTITACSATVGGTAKPVWLSAGSLTACSATVGTTARPVYLNGGTITVGLSAFTACNATAAGTAGPVPQPAKGKQAQFLRGDSSWAAPSTSSDRRVKQDFVNIPDEILDAWDEIVYKRFKMKEEVSEKGDAALYHTGLIVQDIQEIFENKNLDANKYDMIIHEIWPAHDDEYDEEGILTSPKYDGYEQYFMHYEEALSIEAAYLRRRIKALEDRVKELENK